MATMYLDPGPIKAQTLRAEVRDLFERAPAAVPPGVVKVLLNRMPMNRKARNQATHQAKERAAGKGGRVRVPDRAIQGTPTPGLAMVEAHNFRGQATPDRPNGPKAQAAVTEDPKGRRRQAAAPRGLAATVATLKMPASTELAPKVRRGSLAGPKLVQPMAQDRGLATIAAASALKALTAVGAQIGMRPGRGAKTDWTARASKWFPSTESGRLLISF
jgi:hypothetical protein